MSQDTELAAGDAEDAEPGSTEETAAENEEKKGTNIYNGAEWSLILTELEESEGNEGTAYLHMENKKEEGSIHIELRKVTVDGRETVMQSDDSIIELAAGESKDVIVHFTDSGKLSECGIIELYMGIEGVATFAEANGVAFELKRDEERMAELEAAQSTPVDPTVEEAEVYNANGLSITVTGLKIYYVNDSSDALLNFRYESSADRDLSVSYTDVYINDTLVRSGQVMGMGYVGDEDISAGSTSEGGGLYFGEEFLDLIGEEPHEISIVFVIQDFMSDEVLVDSAQVVIPVIVQ